MHKRKYYTHIDGLRAIAILSVVIYHARNNWLAGGFVGVDIFFVVSGFVVTASVIDFRGSFYQFLSFFYTRRLLRIMPALLTCLTLTGLFSLLFVPISHYHHSLSNLLRSAIVGLANFKLIQEGNDYFASSTDLNPLKHSWSLSIEEQFYFLFPLLFTLYLRGGKCRKVFSAALATSIISSLAWVQLQTNELLDFYSTQGRIWELGLGVAAYLISQTETLKRRKPFRNEETFALLLIIILLGATFISSSVSFPSLGTLLATLSTFLLLLLLENTSENFANQILSHRFCEKIGKISYSLYLYHWPVFVAFGWTVGMENNYLAILAIAISFICASLSYCWIENPLRQLKQNHSLKNWQILCIFAALIFLLSKGYKWAFQNEILFTQSKYSRQIFNELQKNAPLNSLCNVQKTGGFYHREGDCPPSPLNKPTLYVLGDSHASAYLPLLNKLILEKGYKVSIKSRQGCGMITLLSPMKDNRVCVDFLLSAQKEILSTAQPGDVLFLPAQRLLRPRSSHGTHLPTPKTHWQRLHKNEEVRKLAIASAPLELKPFIDSKMRIIIDMPKPIFVDPVFRCSDWFNKSHPICRNSLTVSRSKLTTYKAPVDEGLKKLQRAIPDILLWDPFPILCPSNPEDRCYVYNDHKEPLFFDQDHISIFGSMLLYPHFKTFLSKLEQ